MSKELESLCYRLIDAKQQEETAKAVRICLEEQIASLVDGPDNGQKTCKLDDGLSVTVKRGFNYRADCEKILELFSGDSALPPPVKSKTVRELDEKGYEWFRTNEPERFTAVAEFVTVTPKKVAVEVKRK